MLGTVMLVAGLAFGVLGVLGVDAMLFREAMQLTSAASGSRFR